MIKLKHHYVEDVDFLHPETDMPVEDLFAAPDVNEGVQNEIGGQDDESGGEADSDGEQILI